MARHWTSIQRTALPFWKESALADLYVVGGYAQSKGDLDLRLEVEALLDANADAGSFLQHPVLQSPTATFPEADLFEIIIGPYHLLELIGEGGMGQVWLAEQRQPVRRRVAIELIKVGMDTH